MHKVYRAYLLSLVLFTPFLSVGWADDNRDQARQKEILSFFEQFNSSPKKSMDITPPKIYQLPAGAKISLPSKGQLNTELLNKKDQWRKDLIFSQETRNENDDKAAVEGNDRVESLLDQADGIRTIHDVDRYRLTKAFLKQNPWSDDYWPIQKGQLARRYSDPQFPKKGTWDQFHSAYQNTPSNTLVAQKALHLLSPAEKYDLLIGDQNWTLTRFQWAQGRRYFNQFGKVESWMGLCHGWAPVAYHLPRPVNKITVQGLLGQDIPFLPTDIKALGTLLWAQASFPSKFVGGRCNSKNPSKDPSSGRIVDPDCFDTNPATWHSAVINKIALEKKSFIFDATFDYEVWNQPVYGYDLVYFNPQTKDLSRSAWGGIIPLTKYSNDPFSRYRSSQASHIVGVQMKVYYMVETDPIAVATDSPRRDGKAEVTYTYDLELDDQHRILGGEWYSNKHPDFLWTPVTGIKVQSPFDKGLSGTWKAEGPLPHSWAQLASPASAKGFPLEKIIGPLFNKAAAIAPTPNPRPTPTPPRDRDSRHDDRRTPPRRDRDADRNNRNNPREDIRKKAVELLQMTRKFRALALRDLDGGGGIILKGRIKKLPGYSRDFVRSLKLKDLKKLQRKLSKIERKIFSGPFQSRTRELYRALMTQIHRIKLDLR